MNILFPDHAKSAPNTLREEETNSVRECWRRPYRGYDVHAVVKKWSRSSPEKAGEEEHSRWSVGRADEKDTGYVYLLPLAVLIFPRLTSGLTDSLPSGLVKLSDCFFTPVEPYAPQPYAQTPISSFLNSGSNSRVQEPCYLPGKSGTKGSGLQECRRPTPGTRPKHQP